MRTRFEIRKDLLRCGGGKPCKGCKYDGHEECRDKLIMEAAAAMKDDKTQKNSKLYFIECPKCGSGFYEKTTEAEAECRCGERVPLSAELMREAAFQCDCGRRWEMSTNREALTITSRCRCGETVTSKWNKKLKRYTP